MKEREKKEWGDKVMHDLNLLYDINNEEFLLLGGGELYKIFILAAYIQPS